MIIGAAVAVTVIAVEIPVIECVTVSVAVTVCEPAFSNVRSNAHEPVGSVASLGRMALPSLLMKWTVPE